MSDILAQQAWVFPTREACDAAISAYQSSPKRGSVLAADEVMRHHGGEIYDPAVQTRGWLFQVTELSA